MEIWKPVVGYEGIYEVRQGADGGAVRRVAKVKRSFVGRELKSFDGLGYARATLSKEGHKPQLIRLHVLILEAFVGPRPENHEACHRDDDKLNNTIENLYWGTRSDNLRDFWRTSGRSKEKLFGRKK